MRKKVIKARVLSNREIAENCFMMELEAPYLAAKFVPGQFVNVKAWENTTDPLLRIPLAIHAARGKKVKLLYKVVGKGTRFLSAVSKETEIDVLGPLGNGFNPKTTNRRGQSDAVLVAGGHGVAPLYALAEHMAREKKKTTVLIGGGTKKDIMCEKGFKKLGVKVLVATEDGSKGHKGYVTDLLEKYLKKRTGPGTVDTIYACGPRPMLTAVAWMAEEYDREAQVSLDAYVACGIGACLGCAVRTVDGYKLICKDGPVFDAREIAWEEG